MSRNIFELDGLVIQPLNEEDIQRLPADFSLDADLNEFFREECTLYQRGLWVKNYKVVFQAHPTVIVGLVSLLNDSLRFELKSQKRRHVHHLKMYMKSHPAMKIGRMAVNRALKGMGIGSKILNLLKMFFLTENRTGCRFMTVDAYDDPKVLEFYARNGFQEIRLPHGSEGNGDDSVAKGGRSTVSMFFQLNQLLQPSDPLVGAEDSFGSVLHRGLDSVLDEVESIA